MTAEAATDRIRSFFTRSDGEYRFARWGRALVPAIFGASEEGARVLREGFSAAAGLTALGTAAEDPELGANCLVFAVEAWPELRQVPHLERLVPDLERLTGVLGATGANQYRIFDFDEAGAIRLCVTLLRLDDDLARLDPRALALSQAVFALLLWSDRAFLSESPLALTETRPVIRTEIAALVRAGYDPALPAASTDPAHAAALGARMAA